jgi:L-arabinonolactonase
MRNGSLLHPLNSRPEQQFESDKGNKMAAPRVHYILEARNLLGEGPIWDTRDNALYWVDIHAPALLRFDPANSKAAHWPMPSMVGCVVPRARGGFLIALRDGIYGFDPGLGTLSLIVAPEPNQPRNRLNDGKCDRRGRFWVGSMCDDSRKPAGSLYRLDAAATCSRILTDIHVPNSIAWSPDDRILYFADTRTNSIRAFAYDLSTGDVGESRVFVGPGTAPGFPDGATVDEAGCLWSARYGGNAVVRFTPEGRLDRVIELPVSQVTACAFGSRDLTTLFVTTAAMHLSPAQLVEQPLAGSLFAIDVGVRGIPETHFAG